MNNNTYPLLPSIFFPSFPLIFTDIKFAHYPLCILCVLCVMGLFLFSIIGFLYHSSLEGYSSEYPGICFRDILRGIFLHHSSLEGYSPKYGGMFFRKTWSFSRVFLSCKKTGKTLEKLSPFSSFHVGSNIL